VILDSSAVMAILLREPDAERYAATIAAARRRAISAANWFEAAIIADRRGNAVAREAFEPFFETFAVEVAPVTAAVARRARAAYRAFGKGNHPAALNFGDCFAYALAKERGEKLLFKGDDFAQTDIASALG
jgi:ribonuclease VapC